MNFTYLAHNLTLFEGQTFDRKFKWGTVPSPQTDPPTPATPVDLTGHTGVMTIRVKVTDKDPLLRIETATEAFSPNGESAIYFDECEDGIYRVYLNDADTFICAAHKDILGVYDLFLFNSAGESVFKQYGTIQIYAAVSR